MFKKVFGSSEPALRPMAGKDIATVVNIIAETDEDDAEDAAEAFGQGQMDNLFVLTLGGRVLGVTGYNWSEGGSDVVWLSWTYLRESERGKGLGKFMVEDVLRKLHEKKIRKMFISTSDYREDGEDVYADARAFYERLGAKHEMTIPKFYSETENKLIYGLENTGMVAADEAPDEAAEGVTITAVDLDEDSDDVGAMCWEEGGWGVQGLEQALAESRRSRFRMAVLALPEDLSGLAAGTLMEHHFERCGSLKDYYTKGLDQVWWSCKLG